MSIRQPPRRYIHMIVKSKNLCYPLFLGVITRAAVLCAPLPSSINVAYLAVESYENVRLLFSEARAHLGEILSAFEFIDQSCMKTLEDNLNLNPPTDVSPFALVIETHGSNTEHDKEKLDNFLELVMEKGLVLDGTVAEDSVKMLYIWGLRERMAEALQLDGYVYKVI
jgi:D-2-hydroxyglutarate dehydrogenase